MGENEENITVDVSLPVEIEPSSFRLISALGIAGLLSGIVLVTVYLVTLPMIEANRARALERAIFKVIPGCVRYEALVYDAQEQNLSIEREGETGGNDEVRRIFAGYNDQDQLVGFAINAEEPGFQDIIKGIFGYNPNEEVIIGFEVLESKETPGLGDKIIKDDNFVKNFEALAVDPEIVSVKPGRKTQPNEIETITGATISSKAVTRMLQKAMAEWYGVIDQYMEENSKGQ